MMCEYVVLFSHDMRDLALLVKFEPVKRYALVLMIDCTMRILEACCLK
jgi:hypothetical protein